MSGKAFMVIVQAFILVADMGAASSLAPGSKNSSAPQPPATFVNDTGTRFLTVEWKDFGKVVVGMRASSAPGSYNRWQGDGRQTDKGIIFSQMAEEGGDRGTEYLATGGQSKLTVKINPGQTKIKEGELVGIYHHISDEKVAVLAKKDSEAAEKKLDEALKMAAKKASVEDKPAFAEWKRRWPELRSKLVSRENKPGAAGPKSQAANRPTLGQTKPGQSEKTIAQWMALAEASYAGINFINQNVTAATKAEWEGEYDDGLGGSVSLKMQKNGELEFNFRCTREPGSEEVYYSGVCPNAMVKAKSKGKEATADYIDKNEEVKGSAQKTNIHFKLHGHYLLAEIEYPRAFMTRAWLDGVYLKRPPPTAQ